MGVAIGEDLALSGHVPGQGLEFWGRIEVLGQAWIERWTCEQLMQVSGLHGQSRQTQGWSSQGLGPYYSHEGMLWDMYGFKCTNASSGNASSVLSQPQAGLKDCRCRRRPG